MVTILALVVLMLSLIALYYEAELDLTEKGDVVMFYTVKRERRWFILYKA